MKTCKKKLHQYTDDKKTCPECKKIAEKAYEQKPLVFSGDLKTCRAELHQYPIELRRCPECKKIAAAIYEETPERKKSHEETHQSPEYKTWHKEYQNLPDNKEKQRLVRQTDEFKAKKREYHQSDEYKEIDKRRNQSSERKDWQQEYNQSISRQIYRQDPDVKAAHAFNQQKRRTAIAATGNISLLEWENIKLEFNMQCAYCQVHLLTSADGVDDNHPNYLTMDHIVPLLKDGKQLGQHIITNVIPACRHHNCSKNDKDVWEWMEEKHIIPTPKLYPILVKASSIHQEWLDNQQIKLLTE